MTNQNQEHPVIYFDGDCSLCNRFVQYVLKYDTQEMFRFASLQSDFAKGRGFEIPVHSDGSLASMLVEWNGRVYKYSEGVIRVLEHLRGLNKLASIFRILPRAVRDPLYRWVARHRYFFFGKSTSCLTPAAYKGRILG